MGYTTIADLSEHAFDRHMNLLSEVSGSSHRITIGSIVDATKAELGYIKNPLTKCQHCGQWGAVYCACIKCGAPIDPEAGEA